MHRARYNLGVALTGARQIVHVDMDAFYASVEQHDDPSLRGKPVVVGGPSRRGVVCAASYEARPSGVRSAMPMGEALRRCPDAVVVAPRMSRYVEVSARVFEVFRRYTPLVQGLSLDEAFLDVTASRALFGDGATIARLIKDDIRRDTGLAASAGVAPCKFVAKIASDLDKPDGLVVVGAEPSEVQRFLAPLAIERMWGIGPKAALRLHEGGFDTIGDLAVAKEERLERLLGSWGRTVHALSRGEDEREVVVGDAAKSIGAEETYERDVKARRELETHLLAQSSRVARRLHDAGYAGSVVTVKLKYADFTLKTRQTQLLDPVDDTDSIYDAARKLLDRFAPTEKGVRLTGVSVSDLRPGPPPPTLFADPRREKRHKVEIAVNALRERFGEAGLTRASLLDEPRRGR